MPPHMPRRRRSTRQIRAQPGEHRPVTVERSVLAIAWRADTSSPTGPDVRVLHPEHLQLGDTEPSQAVIVRGVPSEERLYDFDTRYEMTTYPTDLLWGPGPAGRAAAWYASTAPPPDTVRSTCRVFVAHVHGKKVFPPRSPAAAASVPGPWLWPGSGGGVQRQLGERDGPPACLARNSRDGPGDGLLPPEALVGGHVDRIRLHPSR